LLAAFDSAQEFYEFCQFPIVSVEYVRRFGITEDTVGEPERKGGQGNENKRGCADERRLPAASAKKLKKNSRRSQSSRAVSSMQLAHSRI
jgi:hypothetical protein